MVIPKKKNIYPKEKEKILYTFSNESPLKYRVHLNMREITPSANVNVKDQIKYILRKLGFKIDSSGNFLGKITWWKHDEDPNIRIYEQVIFKQSSSTQGSIIRPFCVLLYTLIPPFISI